MPRTTLDLDETVLRELKKRAAADRKSLGRTASELLAVALRDRRPARRDKPFRWNTTGGTLLVDILDKEALQAALDDEDAAKLR